MSWSFRVLTNLIVLSAAAQNPALIYQGRGSYSEGIFTSPSNAPRLDLISAIVDYRETYSNLPKTFQASYYLPAANPAYLSVREIQPLYNYRLDAERHKSATDAFERFEWPTATVIQKLNWKEPLKLEHLGGVVRLRKKRPDQDEEMVSPVALFYSSPPKAATLYVFTFYPTQRMKLTFQVFAAGKNTALEPPQNFPSAPAKEAVTVTYNPAAWPEGWYKLVVKGYSLVDNKQIDSTVLFCHYQPQR